MGISELWCSCTPCEKPDGMSSSQQYLNLIEIQQTEITTIQMEGLIEQEVHLFADGYRPLKIKKKKRVVLLQHQQTLSLLTCKCLSLQHFIACWPVADSMAGMMPMYALVVSNDRDKTKNMLTWKVSCLKNILRKTCI